VASLRPQGMASRVPCGLSEATYNWQTGRALTPSAGDRSLLVLCPCRSSRNLSTASSAIPSAWYFRRGATLGSYRLRDNGLRGDWALRFFWGSAV